MAYILLPDRWKRQPDRPVEINMNWPLAQYIDVALLPFGNVDVGIKNMSQASRAIFTRTANARKITRSYGRNGAAFRVEDNGFNHSYDVTGARNTTKRNYVVLMNGFVPSAGNGVKFAAYADYLGISGSQEPFIAVSTVVKALGLPMDPIKPALWGHSITDSDYRCYQNGKLTSTSGSGIAHGVSGPLTTFGGIAGWDTREADIALFVTFEGILLPAEVHETLAENPWQIFKPVSNRLYSFAQTVSATPMWLLIRRAWDRQPW